MRVKIVRFIERDYRKKMLLGHGSGISEEQADAILDQSESHFVDLTFTFYGNGTLTIIDNYTEATLSLKELKGAANEFYVKQRIQMIRDHLEEKILQSA